MFKNLTSLLTLLLISLLMLIPFNGHSKSADVDLDSQFYLIHQIDQQIPIQSSPLINYYITSLGEKVLNAQGFDANRYRFVVIND